MQAFVGHFELPARDPRRLARFFRRAFGWHSEPVDWQEGVYLKLRAPAAESGDRAIQGGVVEAAAAGFDLPLPVIHLLGASAEEALRCVARAGGTVDRQPESVGTTGRFARFRDPEGNLWGLWEPASD